MFCKTPVIGTMLVGAVNCIVVLFAIVAEALIVILLLPTPVTVLFGGIPVPETICVIKTPVVLFKGIVTELLTADVFVIPESTESSLLLKPVIMTGTSLS